MQYSPFLYGRLESVTNAMEFQKEILDNWEIFSICSLQLEGP